jgi:hypothetical protein
MGKQSQVVQINELSTTAAETKEASKFEVSTA